MRNYADVLKQYENELVLEQERIKADKAREKTRKKMEKEGFVPKEIAVEAEMYVWGRYHNHMINKTFYLKPTDEVKVIPVTINDSIWKELPRKWYWPFKRQTEKVFVTRVEKTVIRKWVNYKGDEEYWLKEDLTNE